MTSADKALVPPGTGASRITSNTGMFLRGFRIQNFRSCIDVTIKFQSSLTLIVGENNSGKSNVIDALRLATPPLSGRRSKYFEIDDDPSFGSRDPIQLTAEFSDLTRYQKGQYITALDMKSGNVFYTTRFTPDESLPRHSRVERLAGRVPSPDSEPDKREQINHVYLEPLRDAQRELDSATGSRLSLIIKYLTEESDRDNFLSQANKGLKELEGHTVVTDTKDSIQGHVTDLTAPVRSQAIGLEFEKLKLHRLTRGLRLKMAEHGVELSDLAESGLGYANLLYMASVILELQNAQHAELTLFLVEEPEAHLHPQLQAVLLDYLQDKAEESVRPDDNGPAGRIQVIATTHSPNLASSVGTKNIVALRTKQFAAPVGEKNDAADATVEDQATAKMRNATVAVPLCDIMLSDAERRKIDQYLDVSRAELLFTPRAILVEGISEAVLLPVLAKHSVFAGRKDERALYRKFRGTSIINVGSVDFTPYLKLLLREVDGVRLVDLLIVITDGDPNPEDLGIADDSAVVGHEEDEMEEVTPLNRRAELEALRGELAAEAILLIAEAPHTLEADLMVPIAANGPLLHEAFIKQKPGSERFWTELKASDDPARTFYLKLRKTKRFIRKGEFAHDVAALIRAGGHTFKCPPYLQTAIEAASA